MVAHTFLPTWIHTYIHTVLWNTLRIATIASHDDDEPSIKRERHVANVQQLSMKERIAILSEIISECDLPHFAS